MYTKILVLCFVVVSVAVGLGAAFNNAENAATDCCVAKLECCQAGSACCAADSKLGCCERAAKCCAENRGCCAAVQTCCTTGAACCDAGKPCCGKPGSKAQANSATSAATAKASCCRASS